MYNALRVLGLPILGALAMLFGSFALAHAQAINGSTPLNVTFDSVGGGSTVITWNNGSGLSSEDVYVGGYSLTVGNGAAQDVFCTDVFDNVTRGETWTANEYQTSSADGLPNDNNKPSSYPLAKPPVNVNAIDYISEAYLNPAPANAANYNNQFDAQLAIWDLGLGGKVLYNATEETYTWGPNALGQTVFSADVGSGTLQDVYNIENTALTAEGPQGSDWLQATDDSSNRSQDFTIYGGINLPNNQPLIAPEPSTLVPFALTGLAVLALVGLRRKSGTTNTPAF